MRPKIIFFLMGFAMLLVTSCSPDHLEKDLLTKKETSQIELRSNGATQISGVANYASISVCDYVAEGADFALILRGDLIGCLHTFVEEFDCKSSGIYLESGTELFVGTYNGEEGTFETTYRFQGKFEGCSEGNFVGAEIFGRCQHPIVNGSGTGVFEGVSGRLDFKDNVVTGDLIYRGHLRF